MAFSTKVRDHILKTSNSVSLYLIWLYLLQRLLPLCIIDPENLRRTGSSCNPPLSSSDIISIVQLKESQAEKA